MAACEMPLAAASFLKAASQGSNGAVLRQFGWPNAAVGALNSSAASAARTHCIACIVMIPSGRRSRPADRPAHPAALWLRHFLPVERQLAYPDRGVGEGVGRDPAVGRKPRAFVKDDEFSTTS